MTEGFLVVETERFSGPLDLLLHLIRVQDIDIFDIPIAPITHQFLQATEDLGEAGVDEAGEFLEMAATLIRIKARMLLPSPTDEEEDDPRAELVRRLLEYELVREIATRMRAAESDRGRRFAKGYVEPRPRPALADAPLNATWDQLYAAALRVEPPMHRQTEHRVAMRPVAMRAKVGLIVEAVKRATRIEFSSLVAPWKERMHGVMTLLAGLELGRRRVVALRQRKPFSPLWFYKGRNLDMELDEVAAPGQQADPRAGDAGPGRYPRTPVAEARTEPAAESTT